MSMPRPRYLGRTAFTLLEVLVACGILVVALASVAAILPAAASRLGDAAAMDRAVATAAIAFSEIQSRGLASRGLFADPLSRAGIVFGDGLASAVTTTATTSPYPGVTLYSGSLPILSGTLFRSSTSSTNAILAISNTTTLNARADITRGFSSEDDVQYRPPVSSSSPTNVFGGVTGTSGFRQFNRAVCWGAVLTPEPWGAATGAATACRASVAVFKKPPTAVAMTLLSQGNGIFCTGTTRVPGALQRTRLRPCSFVLALPPGGATGFGNGPQWLGIRSSWMTTGTVSWINNGVLVTSTGSLDALTSGSSQAFVIFNQNPPATMLIGNALTVLTFDNLLLVDQKILPVR